MNTHSKFASVITLSLWAVLALISPSFSADREGAKPDAGAPAEKPGPRDGGREKRGPGDAGGGKKPEAGGAAAKGNGLNTKEGKVFVTYDKDRSGTVTDGEIVAMMEGKQNSRGRREVRKAVDRADKDRDDVLNFDEFLWWYKVGRLDERAKNRE